jgi:hypothetical protein
MNGNVNGNDSHLPEETPPGPKRGARRGTPEKALWPHIPTKLENGLWADFPTKIRIEILTNSGET